MRKIRKHIITICSVIVFMIIIRSFVAEVCYVPSESMIPTIKTGELIIYSKIVYGGLLPNRWAEIPLVNVFTWVRPLRRLDEKHAWGYQRCPGFQYPKIGDVVLFYHPDNREMMLVKRITQIINKGIKQTIDSLSRVSLYQLASREKRKTELFRDKLFIDGVITDSFTPSQNHYFMQGDNVFNSQDSHYYGYVPESDVVGKMGMVLFSWDNEAIGWNKVRWSRLFNIIK